MARLFDKKVLIIDVESTCWEPPEYQPRNEVSEIIEIGVAVVDVQSLEITQNTSILVKPQNSKVSNFCTKLTSLTQEQVDKGISLAEACHRLKKEFKSNERTFVSWGDYDRKMFEKNCQYYKIQYPFGARHHNLKNSFALFYGLDREVGMDIALQQLNMKLDGIHHRGNWDAYNIAKIFAHTLNKFRT